MCQPYVVVVYRALYLQKYRLVVLNPLVLLCGVLRHMNIHPIALYNTGSRVQSSFDAIAVILYSIHWHWIKPDLVIQLYKQFSDAGVGYINPPSFIRTSNFFFHRMRDIVLYRSVIPLACYGPDVDFQ